MSQVPDEPDPDTWPADSTSEGSKGKGPRRKRSRRKGSNSERVIKVPKETAPENLPTIKIIPAADDKKENPITDRQKPVEKLHGMPWMTYNCPLAREQKLSDSNGMASKIDPKSRESGFIVDAVIASVYGKSPGKSVIPPYNAVKDKYASAYFQSPTVRAIMERNQQLRELKNDRNKLSTRNRCKSTPSPDELRKRRDQFVVDAVKVEHTRSRFCDIIPSYEANQDRNCKRYFKRPDVKKLLKVTLTPRQ